MRLAAYSTLLVAVAACVSPVRPTAPSPVAPTVERDARSAWLGLPSTTNTCREHYDYFPDGGPAIFYCHARQLLTVERLEQLAGMPSTRIQPGTAPAVAAAFRHYDPRFVEWLRRALLPARSDARFREQTQPIYDRYVAPLARRYLATRRLMSARRGWTDGEVRWVREAIVRGELPERWYAQRYESLGEAALDRSGWDVNIGPNAVAFWIRRELDGSAPAFAAALEELVSLYDAAWLFKGAGVVDTARIGTSGARPSTGAALDELQVSRVWRDRRRLAGLVIRVRGRVVKFDAGILGRNWLHLRDGSGTVQVDDDLTVTTSEEAEIGEVATIEGIVSVDRDFGAGYVYPVLLERARIIHHGPGTPTPPQTFDGSGGTEQGETAEAPGKAAAQADEEGAPPICGTVREQLSVGPYVYLRLGTAKGDVWAAVPARRAAPGERICVRDPVPMRDFDSTTLKRRFQLIYFGRVE